ncbi:MAG: recombinase family protein [Phormidesmis sp.]
MRSKKKGAINEKECDRIFCDKDESGAKDSRPEWDNCLDHLRQGDVLVIWKLDRASRSTKQLIELAEDLEKRGVELRSLKEQIDTASAMGNLFFRMTALIAELERDISASVLSRGWRQLEPEGEHH